VRSRIVRHRRRITALDLRVACVLSVLNMKMRFNSNPGRDGIPSVPREDGARRRRIFSMVAAAAIAALAISTGCKSSAGPDAGGSSFLALQATFTPYQTWTTFNDPGPVDDGTYPADVLGARIQYINTLPPHGSTEFPVGTVIVEQRLTGTMHTLAAVKRGGGFNANGATNWEWFELSLATGAPTIVWRGIAPPVGDTYGGAGVDCNSCHMTCGASNDYVCSPKLQLASF
jgi:hypothetical protein